jgi:hypothetical protein
MLIIALSTHLLAMIAPSVLSRPPHRSAAARMSDPSVARAEELVHLLNDGRGAAIHSANGPYPSARDRSEEQRTRIRLLIDELAASGSGRRYLSDQRYTGDGVGGERLWDSYELAYFEGSVDGRGMASNHTNATDGAGSPARGLRARVLGALFSLRFSLQHVCPPNLAVNDVGFSFCGIPASIITRATFTMLDDAELRSIKEEFGTDLRAGTTVRLDFEQPQLILGPRRRPLLKFGFGPASAQARAVPGKENKPRGLPPVNLCTTYLDGRLRLGLASKGTRLVFTRGGLAAEPWAAALEDALKCRSTSGRLAAASAASVVLGLLRPGPVRKWAWLATATVWALRVADERRRARV